MLQCGTEKSKIMKERSCYLMKRSILLVLICLAVGIPRYASAVEPESDVPNGVVAKICMNRFAEGQLASVSILQSDDKQRRIYLLRPDITRFSHAPFTYFDEKGDEILTVPEFPVSPDEHPPILKKRDKLIEGLKEFGSFACEKQ